MSNDEIRKNIGHATSYGYAKSTGRLPEGMDEGAYAELMADYVTVGQTAVAAKNAAVAAKDAAETEASTATTKAAEASQSATTATNAANAAQADADAAALDASQAMSAASTATTKASEASQSATTATNAKNDAVTAKTAAQAAQTAAETAEDNAETSASAAAASAASVAESAAQIQTNAEDISQLKSELTDLIDPTLSTAGKAADAKKTGDELSDLSSNLKNVFDTFPTATDAGAVAVFENVDETPLKSVIVDIDYNSNGVAQTVIRHSGKNILPFTVGVTTKNDVTFTVNADGSIKFNGTASTSFAHTFAEFALDAGEYVVSSIGSNTAESSTGGCTIYVRDQDHSATLASFRLSTFGEMAFTISAKTNIRFYALINSGVTVSGTLLPMICRKVLNGGRFEKYLAIDTYTINFENTIYGGTYDPINGVLVSKLAPDGSDLTDPVVYAADSISIVPFNGINCIWANIGDVEVTNTVLKNDDGIVWENGSVQNSETGTFNQSDAYKYTVNYIPITSGRLAVNCTPRFILFYDADKNYTEYCENDVDLSKVQKASNAYCRVVVSTTNYTGIVVIGDETPNALALALTINKYRYLAFAFGNQGKYGMYVLGSNDLRHFNCLNIDIPFISNINSGVRDPAILFYDGWYWIVYTPANGLAVGSQMGLARTKDFVTWEEFDNLIVTPSNGDDLSEGYTWAPDFFKEGDDIYIVVSCSTSTVTQDFKHRIMRFYPDTHSVGEAFTTNLSFIDAHIYKENGTYYALGAGGNLWKSDTLLSDEWVALSNTGLSFEHYEAQFAVKLDNGKWRVFAQNVAGAIGNAYYYYQDSVGETFESGFGDRVQLTYDQATKDACAKKWSVTTGYFWHFTIYDRNCWSVNNNNFE